MSQLRRRSVSADNWGKPELNDAGEPVCRWCRAPVQRPRRTFCSDACVHEWRIRSSPSYVRKEVKKRDRGVCQSCGFDVRAAERAWRLQKPPGSDRRARKAWRAAKPRWEADHIVPVADGGGECGLDNYRLLCRACHLAVTLAWRRARDWRARIPAPCSLIHNPQSRIPNRESPIPNPPSLSPEFNPRVQNPEARVGSPTRAPRSGNPDSECGIRTAMRLGIRD